MRIETDSIGEVQVPEDRYYGAQTQRALKHFRIGEQRFPSSIIRAFGLVKKAATLAHSKLGLLPPDKCSWIGLACDELIAGKWDNHFPLVIWQSGSGTQMNMNVNEVIANRAIELAGGRIGSKVPIHPNDDVNKSQSTNDVFPSVMHVAAIEQLENDLLPALSALAHSFAQKAESYKHLVKIGRTHCMDATPLTFGQELSGYTAQLNFAAKRIKETLVSLFEIPLGGSAVGTGLNTHPAFAETAVRILAELSSRPFTICENRFAALAAHDALYNASSSLSLLASSLFKIANDIRWLASGPRCGLQEIRLPENEPGSSIMPGKVNPTQIEALTMVAIKVMGNHSIINMACSQGNLELNVYKPLIIHTFLESLSLLADSCRSFRENCVDGLEARPEVMAAYVERSLMLATALNPIIGYDNAGKIARLAYIENLTLKQAAVKLGILTEEEFDKHVRPEKMYEPQIP